MDAKERERLMAFERMAAEIRAAYAETSAALDRLRGDGKEKTARFRELLGQKLVLARQIALLEKYGL